MKGGEEEGRGIGAREGKEEGREGMAFKVNYNCDKVRVDV